MREFPGPHPERIHAGPPSQIQQCKSLPILLHVHCNKFDHPSEQRLDYNVPVAAPPEQGVDQLRICPDTHWWPLLDVSCNNSKPRKSRYCQMQLNLGINNIKVIVYLSYLPAAACFTALYGWRVLILFAFSKKANRLFSLTVPHREWPLAADSCSWNSNN